jgi:hypothetical protein
MVFLETLVVIGKDPDQPLHTEDDCGEQSHEREGKERVKGITRHHPWFERAIENHDCSPVRISSPFSKP